MQNKYKCRLCRDLYETVISIIIEYNKLAQEKYKRRNHWIRKVIYWELDERLKFGLWYLYKPESVIENKMHKILLYFEIQKDHLIPAR